MFENQNLAILFFTLIVVMLGFGVIIPILSFLVEKSGESGDGTQQCLHESRARDRTDVGRHGIGLESEFPLHNRLDTSCGSGL